MRNDKLKHKYLFCIFTHSYVYKYSIILFILFRLSLADFVHVNHSSRWSVTAIVGGTQGDYKNISHPIMRLAHYIG